MLSMNEIIHFNVEIPLCDLLLNARGEEKRESSLASLSPIRPPPLLLRFVWK
jgi:hypothetical protein